MGATGQSKEKRYFSEHSRSISKNSFEEYWKEKAKSIEWENFPTKILDDSNSPFYKWFPDGKLNFCYNALERHIKNGLGDNKALIWESGYNYPTEIYTYNNLVKIVNKFAKVFIDFGLAKGDRLIIYMPMIPQAIFTMMACWKIGAIHSVVFGGFAPAEMSERILDCKPKFIVLASVGIEPRKKINYFKNICESMKIVTKKNKELENIKVLLYQRDNVLTIDQKEIDESNLKKNVIILNKQLNQVEEDIAIPPVIMNSNDPLYILYTSGTTGIPKGIVRDTGGTAVTASFIMKEVINLNPGDVIFCSSDIGWIVGHLFIVYGPLINGATTIIYEGKPTLPDCGISFKIIEKYKCKIFYTCSTVLRVFRKEDPECKIIHKYNLSSLESVCLSGEICDKESFKYIQECVGKNKVINDHWWQTETGYPVCCNNIKIHTFPNTPGVTGPALPGFDVHIMNKKEEDESLTEIDEPKKSGLVCIKLPTPPSFMTTLWENDNAYIERYISKDKQYYITGDIGFFDEKKQITILSRNDDIIKIAGHRLTTGKIEEVILKVPEVVECAVVSLKDYIKGEVPFGFIILKNNTKKEDLDKIKNNIMNKVANEIGAISRLKGILFSEKLPKTRSGKIIRKLLKQIINGDKLDIPPTIEDESVIDYIQNKLKEEKILK